jgi:hypothetical protein
MARRKTLKTFVPIMSENSASGLRWFSVLYSASPLLHKMRSKAREMTQHGGPPGWLKESVKAG